jgi:hypothetical protein
MLNVRADRKDRIQLSAREKKLGGTSLCRITRSIGISYL